MSLDSGGALLPVLVIGEVRWSPVTIRKFLSKPVLPARRVEDAF
jgi:hypothetical protein